jgi:nucleotide-binding universal stress UspA family protein
VLQSTHAPAAPGYSIALRGFVVMSVILVPTADRPECVFALDAAFRLAEVLDANVAGCHVRPQRGEPWADTAAPRRVTHVESAESTKPIDNAGARRLFAEAARSHGFAVTRRFAARHRKRAVWHELVGSPARALGIAGPVADLSVVSRPKPQGGRARAFLLAALLDTGRPVLVLPQRSVRRLTKRVVIAWNQSAEAAAAVTAAVPLLKLTERVVIVSAGPENRAGPKSSQLSQYLATFDIEAECLRTPGRDVEREIDAAYREVDAELLVMGAYSRSRLREILFGGVTEHMLFTTSLPVFLLHR